MTGTKPGNHNTHKMWGQRGILLLFMLGGFALRLYRLGVQSLWYDETVSAYLASKPVAGLIAHTAGDIHPPGYYLLLHFWTLLAGNTEYALAFFSLVFGLLLIPLSYALARRLLGRRAALWTALLVTISPYNLWYSQEVRMYTLGAALGLLALWCALEMVKGRANQSVYRYAAGGYILAAAAGLYALYYFGFLLVALNLFIIGHILGNLSPARRLAPSLTWLLAQVVVLILYLPWLSIAWRQATNPPVPPWRSFIPPHTLVLEAWTALSLGQSVQPGQVWPVLLVTGVLFLLGLFNNKSRILLVTYTFGPLALIYLISLMVPLYHVRYLFTYAPAFYMLLGAGLAWLARRARWLAALAALALLAGSVFSIRELHTNPRYASDDFRAATAFIEERWRPGDVILINAGYAYTGLLYYYEGPIAGQVRLAAYRPNDGASAPADRPLLLSSGTVDGDPDLGWANPDSDFYAISEAETAAALTRVTQTFPRIWMLRIYDTVTDPHGFIRAWLESNMVMFEDQPFSGEAFMRVQGFMSPTSPASPEGNEVKLEGGVTLAGWQFASAVLPGESLDVVLWWQADAPPATDYAVSLKLWGTEGQSQDSAVYLAAQQDEWPVGSLLFTSSWPPGRVIRHPMSLQLPPDLPAGQYWLNVEMYDPASVQPLPRRDGLGNSVALGPVTVTQPSR